MILPEANNFDYLRPMKAVAYVHERLLAFFVDVLVVAPFASFLIYPTWKEAEILRRVSPFSTDLVKFNMGIGLYFLFIYFIYETICLWKWNATVGKHVFFMHVRNFQSEKKLPFFQVLNRTFLKCLSFIFLGVPFFEILLHPYRRTFYDLASESMVLTKKILYPDPGPEYRSESNRAVFYGSVFYIFAFTALMFLPDFLHKNFENALALNAEYKKMEKCFPMADYTRTERLNFLTVLTFLGVGNNECLWDEANRLVWSPSPEDRELAIFAKAVVEVATNGFQNLNKDLKIDKIEMKEEPSYVQNLCGSKPLSIVNTEGSLARVRNPLCSSLYLLQSFVKQQNLNLSDQNTIIADLQLMPTSNWVKFIAILLLEKNPSRLALFQDDLSRHPLLNSYLRQYASGFLGFLRMKSQNPISIEYNRATLDALPDLQKKNLAEWICLQYWDSDSGCFQQSNKKDYPFMSSFQGNRSSLRVPASIKAKRSGP